MLKNMPYRKFHPRQYQCLPDINDDDDSFDHDDIQSFSSMKLAKDQDKPTKWKRSDPAKRKLNMDSTTTASSSASPPHVVSQGSSLSTVLEHPRSETKSGVAVLSKIPDTKPTGFIEERDPPTSIDTSFLHRRRDTKKKSEAAFPAAFETPVPQQHGKKEGNGGLRGAQTLPSPKENRHPQTKLFSMCAAPAPSGSSAEEEGTADARAALAPSSALNLIQCWRNVGTGLNERELVDAQNLQIKNVSNKDPLLVALQVVRLKRELKKLRNDPDSRRSFEPNNEKTEGSLQRKRVRFAEELVTDVRERPFTEPEEMDKLYFVNGELEELEWDRSNVELDQFECIMQETNASHMPHVEVEHNSRRLHSIENEGLPHSLSDLSFY